MDDQKNNQTDQDAMNRLQNIAEAELKKLASERTVERWLKKMRDAEIEKTLGKESIDALTVFISTPLGQWLTAIIILELLAKAKFFSQISVDILISVLTSIEVIKAIGGGQGILSMIAGLAGIAK